MANFQLDPRRFLPAGLDILIGGLERFPRAFYTASQPPPRMHEQYMVAIVEPHLLRIWWLFAVNKSFSSSREIFR